MKATLLASLFALALASATLAAPHESLQAHPAQTSNAQSSSGHAHTATPRASTLAEYRARIHEAVTPLEELASLYELVKKSEMPEVWSKEGFNSDFVMELPKREATTLDKVRGLLPPKEQVEWGGSFVEVDNTWLHAALNESVRGGDYDKRALALRGVAGRLRALEAQLAEAEGTRASDDKDAERGRLNAILRDPAFNRETRPQGGALARLVERFFEWVRSLFPNSGPSITPGASPRISRLAQFVVLCLCLVVIAYVARRLWLRRSRGPRTLKPRRGARIILGERLEAEQTAADLLDDAEQLARAGDLRGAIRKAYVALLCELGDRGVVRLAQHKTNRDYLNAVRRAAPTRLYTEMLPLTFDFELHWYGLQDASDSDWQSFKTRCRQALRVI
ncbi:MAG: hypothetical protein QOJ70_2733 [Acidobacteriota bacterium]|jgi:hypothetical protein|nr:hypothetical protein [Acidobacteriota bacterium]